MNGWPWPRFVAQWGVLMQPKNRYRMTPGVRNSGIVNWLIYLFYSRAVFGLQPTVYDELRILEERNHQHNTTHNTTQHHTTPHITREDSERPKAKLKPTARENGEGSVSPSQKYYAKKFKFQLIVQFIFSQHFEYASKSVSLKAQC